jgi:hypothetical protein
VCGLLQAQHRVEAAISHVGLSLGGKNLIHTRLHDFVRQLLVQRLKPLAAPGAASAAIAAFGSGTCMRMCMRRLAAAAGSRLTAAASCALAAICGWQWGVLAECRGGVAMDRHASRKDATALLRVTQRALQHHLLLLHRDGCLQEHQTTTNSTGCLSAHPSHSKCHMTQMLAH